MSGWFMAAGAAVGVASSVMGARAQAKQADRMRAQEITGAKQTYKATEHSANLLKAATRETQYNMTEEILRVGASRDADVKEEIQRQTSSLAAQSEGLTSGRSKGRQMLAAEVKANKFLQDSKAQTTNMINKVTEEADAKTNEINNKLMNAHSEMATILSTPGAIYQQNPMEVVQAGISGAQSGASIGKAYNTWSKGD